MEVEWGKGGKYKTGRRLTPAGSIHQFEIEAVITRIYNF